MVARMVAHVRRTGGGRTAIGGDRPVDRACLVARQPRNPAM